MARNVLVNIAIVLLATLLIIRAVVVDGQHCTIVLSSRVLGEGPSRVLLSLIS